MLPTSIIVQPLLLLFDTKINDIIDILLIKLISNVGFWILLYTHTWNTLFFCIKTFPWMNVDGGRRESGWKRIIDCASEELCVFVYSTTSIHLSFSLHLSIFRTRSFATINFSFYFCKCLISSIKNFGVWNQLKINDFYF